MRAPRKAYYEKFKKMWLDGVLFPIKRKMIDRTKNIKHRQNRR